MAKHITAAVSTRAVLQRINRKLKPELEQVRKARGALLYQQDFGDYYQIDLNRNWITDRDVNLEKLARKLECLHPWESVGEEK